MRAKSFIYLRGRYAAFGLAASLMSLPSVNGMCSNVNVKGISNSVEVNAICSSYAILGSEYKNGTNTEQNYAKALEMFVKGANAGSAECMHQLGHMYFKGLGCQQSYEKAFKYFTDAMEKDYTPSKYMTAICYRNGYGTNVDYVLAGKLLDELAKDGYSPAIKELEHVNGESVNMFVDKYDKSVFSKTGAVGQEINGAFIGDLVVYDDSRQHILNVIPVNVFVSQSDNEISGSIKIDSESYPFSASIKNNQIDFNNSSLLLESRYSDILLDYKLVSAQIYHNGDELCMNLNSELTGLEEPGHPMYLFTNKGTADAIQEVAEQSVYISCTALSRNQVQLDYEVPEHTSKLSIQVCNTAGVILYEINGNNVQAGMKSVLMNISTSDNTLLIKFLSDDFSFNKKIIIK